MISARAAAAVCGFVLVLAGCSDSDSSDEDPFADRVTVEGLQDTVLKFATEAPIELDGEPLDGCAWSDDEDLKASVAEQDGAESAEVLECDGGEGSIMSIKTYADATLAEDAALGELVPTFHYGEITVSGPPNREQRDQFHTSLMADCGCGQILHSGIDAGR